MTTLPLKPPPHDADRDGIDDRLPVALTPWLRAQRAVLALLARAPAVRLRAAAATTPEVLACAALPSVNAAPMTTILPRTVTAKVGGYERAEPRGTEWCKRAGLSLDDGAGARLVHSEVGEFLARRWGQYGIAVALAVCNEAATWPHVSSGHDVFDRVTGDSRLQHRGYFGRQGGRWAASLQDPSRRALAGFGVGRELHEAGHDMTRGARRWDDGYTQDRLSAAGRVRYDAIGIVQKWGAEGWEWVGPIFEANGTTVLIDPYRLALFRFVGKGRAEVWRGVQAVKDGRERWKVRG